MNAVMKELWPTLQFKWLNGELTTSFYKEIFYSTYLAKLTDALR